MPSKVNPLRLNPLQLKTLAILQEIARQPSFAKPVPDSEDVAILAMPHAHGDHFHIGGALIMGRDATGLNNPSVWAVLERKGLVGFSPEGARTLTAAGRGYETGAGVIHRADH